MNTPARSRLIIAAIIVTLAFIALCALIFSGEWQVPPITVRPS